MHTRGHLGIGLVAAAPMVVVLHHLGYGHAAVPASVLFVVLSPLPDVDVHIPGLAHRGPTHSLPFAIVAGLVVGQGVRHVGPVFVGGEAIVLGMLGFVIGVLAVTLHVLADVVTPMGVYLLWPLSPERRSLGLVRSANPIVNRALFVSGAVCWSVVVMRVGVT